MTPLQVFANVLLSVLLVAVNHWLFGYVEGEPMIVPFIVDILLIVAIFTSNAANRAGVR